MNFALILFVLTLVTGALYALDVLRFRKLRAKDAGEPLWVEWGQVFPRHPHCFRAPLLHCRTVQDSSGSMIPTLLVGDFILVNKFTYGIRLPVINKKIVDINLPQRGDVMVFRYPEEPSLDYIKRVVGFRGQGRVSEQALDHQRKTRGGEEACRLSSSGTGLLLEQYVENMDGVEHRMLNDTDAPAYIPDVASFPNRENCLYNASGVVYTVPRALLHGR